MDCGDGAHTTVADRPARPRAADAPAPGARPDGANTETRPVDTRTADTRTTGAPTAAARAAEGLDLDDRTAGARAAGDRTEPGGLVVDGHVRLGTGREVALAADTLLSTMDALGIDLALVAPDERCIAVANAEGNDLTTAAARDSAGRLLAYAVASPWHGLAAITELSRARDNGAVALAVDPVLQGFDLLDGLIDPLLEFAAEHRWPVYLRTGTPPSALPLPLATLARRHPEVSFLMGRSGATDFWIDAAPALRYATNLYADTSYAPWDTVLSEFATDPEIGTERVVFCTDSPYTVATSEIRRVRDWTIADTAKAQVLGGTLLGLLGDAPPGVRDR